VEKKLLFKLLPCNSTLGNTLVILQTSYLASNSEMRRRGIFRRPDINKAGDQRKTNTGRLLSRGKANGPTHPHAEGKPRRYSYIGESYFNN
jgi:hypothetical protein